MNKRQLKKEMTHQEIVNAAEQLFLTHSIAAVQMLDIAKKAQVSNATLFRYFPSKADIIVAVLAQLSEQTNHYADALYALEATAYEKLDYLLQFFMTTPEDLKQKMTCYVEALEILATQYPAHAQTAAFKTYNKLLRQIATLAKQDNTLRTTIDIETYIYAAVASFSFTSMKLARQQPIPFLPPLEQAHAQLAALKDMLLSSLKGH